MELEPPASKNWLKESVMSKPGQRSEGKKLMRSDQSNLKLILNKVNWKPKLIMKKLVKMRLIS